MDTDAVVTISEAVADERTVEIREEIDSLGVATRVLVASEAQSMDDRLQAIYVRLDACAESDSNLLILLEEIRRDLENLRTEITQLTSRTATAEALALVAMETEDLNDDAEGLQTIPVEPEPEPKPEAKGSRKFSLF